MANLQERFREDVAHVKTDSDKASQKLVKRLKQMTPVEFLRLPPRTFASLTAAQYRKIVATIAPDMELPASPPVEELAFDKRSWRERWRGRSALTRVFTLTVMTTLIVVMAAIMTPFAWKWFWSHMGIVRPVTTATWPVCKRLSPYTDGCVYYPAQNLNWAQVAQQLAMSPEELYAANQHIPAQYIPANSTVVVWRHRGRLEQ